MKHWLKIVGAATAPLASDWMSELGRDGEGRRDLLDRVRFPRNKRPSGIDAGDRLVYYAAGAQRYFAIVEVISDEPYDSREDERWPFALDVRARLLVPHLQDAPPIQDLQLRKGNLSVRHGSHIHLEPHQFSLAVKGLAATVTR